MAFEPGKYDVVIVKAGMTESEAGTLGIGFELRNETAGTIYHTMWINDNTKERSARTLAEFGIEAGALSSAAFWEDPGAVLVGKPASITCDNEEYPKNSGKFSLKVKWLNGPNRKPKAAKAGASQRLAALFSGTSGNLFASAPEDDGDDVPFEERD